MANTNRSWWWWTRGALAILLAALLACIALPSLGKVVVHGPTAHVTWPIARVLPAIGLLVFSLGCIFIGMWKRWAFEIVGWAILVVFLLAGMMG
jgi:hypothetical protein